jgi:hypothetical protein
MKKQIFLHSAVPFTGDIYKRITFEPVISKMSSEKSYEVLKLLDLFFIVLIAIYIFGFEYLPMQDYPNWLYQGFLFKEYLLYGDMLHGFFHFYPYIPPNTISTLIIGCLSVVVSPLLAGKIFLFFTALLLYFGIKSYLRLFIRSQIIFIPCVAFYLIFNLQFLMGFINFSFGLGLGLLVISYLVRNDLSVNRIMLSLLFLLVYLSHFFAFAIIPLFLVVYALHTKKYRVIFSLVPAFLPVVILFIEYYFTKTISDLPVFADNDSISGQFHLILHNIFSVIIPFHHYKWLTETGLVTKSGNYLFSFSVGIFFLYIFFRAWKKKVWTLTLRISLTIIVLIAIMPHYLGGVMLPASRLVLFFILNIVALFFFERPSNLSRRISNIIVIALATASFSHNLVNAYYFNKQMSLGVIPIDAIMEPKYEIEGTDGFMHLLFYHGIEHKEALRTFRSGLFTYPDEEKGDSFGNR